MAAPSVTGFVSQENPQPDLIPDLCRKCRAPIVREHHYVNRGVFLETLLCANEHLIQSKWIA